MRNWKLTVLKVVLGIVGAIQVVFGLAYLFMPAQFNQALGFSPVLPWTDYMARIAGARFLALAFGMYLAFRDPRKHITWIQAMIFVQAVDFFAALYATLSGAAAFGQMASAIILPFLWAVLLTVFYPREAAKPHEVVKAPEAAKA